MTPLALGIAAASGSYRCALRREDGVILERESRDRSEDAAVVVQRLLADAGRRPAELGELRLDLGPGSYTGLRVAVTFVRVLAAFGGVPVLAGTHFELLAAAAWRAAGTPPARALRPVLDARRGRWHHARVELGEHVVLSEAPAAVPFDVLRAALRGDELVLASAGLLAQLASLLPAGTALAAAPAVHGRDLFDPRVALRTVAAEELEPLYLMGSYAE